VSLSRRQLRTLRRIERGLAASDPGLNQRGRSITERVRDWCAENWNDP